MQQHLGRLEGVARVEVSLEQGKVAIFAKDASRLDPVKVFKATYDSGVSVVEMTMDAAGWLERDARNGLVFRLSGDQIYPVIDNDIAKAFAESVQPEQIFVRARLFLKTGKQKVKTLGIVRLELLDARKP